jgi:hypothetical protein
MEGAQLSLPFNTRLKTKTMSKFLSMQWFKSKIEHAVEKAIAKKIENLMEEEDNEIPAGDDYDVDRKVYIRLKLVNDVLTIVLNDGSILTKTNATQEDFERARNAVSEDQLYTICTTQEVLEERRRQEAEAKRIKALQQGIKSLEGLNDFEIEGNSVKLRGTGRTMPQLLVEKFIELVQEEKYLAGFNPGSIEDRLKDDEEYQALKRFFMWCCLNPRAEVANDLYDFLNKNSFRITKQGFFVALRNVVTLHGGTELVQFISNAYNKIKAVWKKDPDAYTVFLENGEYKLVHYSELYETIEEYDDETDEYYEDEIAVNHGEKIGGLTDLYLDLPNRHENRFTDAHTRTFDIRIGRVVNMPPEECNWSTADCAHAGLHFTSDHINYVGCGDQSVLILINPMKVVGIGEQKGRCYEYLPIMTVPTEESTTILHDLDFDTLELDESFVINELENLAEIAKQGFVTEASKHQFNIPAMTYSQIENIVSQLDDMRASVSKRVVSIK